MACLSRPGLFEQREAFDAKSETLDDCLQGIKALRQAEFSGDFHFNDQADYTCVADGPSRVRTAPAR